MKFLGFPLIALASIAPLCAQETAPPPASPAASPQPADLPLPSSRKAIVIEPAERNPFGRFQIKTATDFGIVQGETEEAKLKSMLARMSVRGVIKGADGIQAVVFGPVTVRVGDELPALVNPQLERIAVREITPDRIIFGFVEKDGNTGLRSFSVQYNLDPKIRYALPVDVMESAGGRRPFPLRGVMQAPPNEGL